MNLIFLLVFLLSAGILNVLFWRMYLNKSPCLKQLPVLNRLGDTFSATSLKSVNHSRITGNFFEYLVLYWLSKNGFECARIDHVGIDLVAKDPQGKSLGISVKGRSRYDGTDNVSINIHESDILKAEEVCRRFIQSSPYFAIVVDRKNGIRGFLLSTEKLRSLCPENKGMRYWKMTDDFVKKYENDPEITTF